MPLLLYAPCPLLYATSDGPDLLPHKDKVANSETDESHGDNRNQIRDDDKEALRKGKRVLKSSRRKLLQGSHKSIAMGLVVYSSG